MSMQPYSNNPIELRKQAVRKYSRNAVVSAGGGIVAGIAFGLLVHSFSTFVLLSIIGIALGGFFYNKVRKIVNYQDPQ